MRGIQPTRTLTLAGLAALVIWALVSGPAAPVAALSGPVFSTTTTSSPSGSPTSTTSSDSPTSTSDPNGTTPTSLDVPTSDPGSSTTTTTDGSGDGSGSTDSSDGSTTSTTSSGPTTTVPPTPEMAAEQASVRRSGPSSTAPLIAALAPLAKLGLTPEQIAILGFGQFPVAGLASYSDIFLEYRSWPEPHVHQGIDISAPAGTPLRSPADGTLTYSDADPEGYGLTALVTQTDGTVYLLAHMSATVLGLDSGATVTQGQIIGFVGATGDSTGPHLDFEIHPHGGAAIDAKPILDGYIAAAIEAAPGLIARYEGSAASPADAPIVSIPAPGPTLPPARDSLEGSTGHPIAMVSAGHQPVRYVAGAAGLLILGGVAWFVYRSRRLSKPGWVDS